MDLKLTRLAQHQCHEGYIINIANYAEVIHEVTRWLNNITSRWRHQTMLCW